MSLVRAFLAVPLSTELRASIAGIQSQLKAQGPGVRWSNPEKIHLTLRFFGEATQETLEKIKVSMLSVKDIQSPFWVAGRGLDRTTDQQQDEHSQHTFSGFDPNWRDMMAENDRNRAIELAMGQIEKQFGKGSIMRLGEDAVIPDIQSISTGALSLDIALGLGGVPRGRIIEIYGPESSGKTTLALHIAAEAQKVGGIAAFVDAEHALDINYAKKLGVSTDDLLVSQPDTGEQALEIVEVLVRSGAIDVMIIDSVAALVPRAEIEGEMGDSHMGLQARLMSQALRKLTGTISKSSCCVIFINQIRMKIGVMFGNPETTTGGNALKFYSSVRMDIRRIAALKQGQDVVGNRTRVKVVKNKVAPPFKEAEFDIMYGAGISREGDLVDLGVECGIVDKSGSWFSYGDERIGQGRENAKQFLADHPEMATDIEARILAHYELKPAGPSSEGE